MIVDALGNPLALSLTGGNAHDITQAEPKDDENKFPKSIATGRAHEVSTTRNDTWWNAHSTPSQRRCVFTQPRPISDIDVLIDRGRTSI